MTDGDPRPTTIEELERAVWPSFAMLAEIKLDLFTCLKDEDYTEKEHRAWLQDAGFGDFQRKILPDGFSLMRARKTARGGLQ
jgi:hypothetical protein